jgi:hypothetical protein
LKAPAQIRQGLSAHPAAPLARTVGSHEEQQRATSAAPVEGQPPDESISSGTR